MPAQSVPNSPGTVTPEATIISRDKDEASGHVKVTFRVPRNGLDDPIAVVGDFNGWDPTATVLSGGATCQASAVVEAGRRYAFRYLAGGERWFNDEAADDCQPNRFGGSDSVLDLTTY